MLNQIESANGVEVSRYLGNFGKTNNNRYKHIINPV